MWIRNIRLVGRLAGGITSESGSIEIQDGTIVRVLTDTNTADADPESEMDEAIFDGRGMTLLPGLIDAHTHIAGLRNYDPFQLQDPMRFFTQTCLMARRYLDYGFTTIRDCGTPLRVNTAVRDAIADGLFDGPRILSSGLIIGPTEEGSQSALSDIYSYADSPDEARKAVRREIAEQADFIKIYTSGSALDRHGDPDEPIMTREECETIVETAKRKRTHVAAHAHGDGAIRMAIQAGVHTIEHASYISDDTLRLLLEEGDTWLIPTVSAMYQNPETTSPEYMYLVEKLRKMLERSAVCLHRAYQAGAKIGFGTDSCPGMDQYEHGIEFRYRKEACGFRDEDILLQATKNSAEALGLADVCGEIREGLAADLILVEGKPEQDISVMYQKPAHVWRGGKQIR